MITEEDQSCNAHISKCVVLIVKTMSTWRQQSRLFDCYKPIFRSTISGEILIGVYTWMLIIKL